MSEERARILGLLAKGKITASEAASLLDALGEEKEQPSDVGKADGAAKGMPKFLYVKVVSTNNDNVDVKVPLSLVRSGLKLTSLIPPQAMDQLNDSMSEHGMSFDLQNLKSEDIDELVMGLREMEINVNSANGDNIRVFCD